MEGLPRHGGSVAQGRTWEAADRPRAFLRTADRAGEIYLSEGRDTRRTKNSPLLNTSESRMPGMAVRMAMDPVWFQRSKAHEAEKAHKAAELRTTCPRAPANTLEGCAISGAFS